MQKYGGEVDMDIEQILQEVDKDGDGRIDYDEFCAMMAAGNESSLSSKSTLRRGNLAEKVVTGQPAGNGY